MQCEYPVGILLNIKPICFPDQCLWTMYIFAVRWVMEHSNHIPPCFLVMFFCFFFRLVVLLFQFQVSFSLWCRQYNLFLTDFFLLRRGVYLTNGDNKTTFHFRGSTSGFSLCWLCYRLGRCWRWWCLFCLLMLVMQASTVMGQTWSSVVPGTMFYNLEAVSNVR